MKINNDHMYHGAALTQIAEHPQFTTVNSFKYKGRASRSAFTINDHIGVYLKYATLPKPPFYEYIFTFTNEHRKELKSLQRGKQSVFLGLICIEAKEICCVTIAQFNEMVRIRREANGGEQDQYTILVTAPERSQLRVYSNAPGEKRKKLDEILVPRNAFPSVLFR